jgi:hypothetical protein
VRAVALNSEKSSPTQQQGSRRTIGYETVRSRSGSKPTLWMDKFNRRTFLKASRATVGTTSQCLEVKIIASCSIAMIDLMPD